MDNNYYNAEDEIAVSLGSTEKIEYDDKYILKGLMEGKTREDIALELNHKNYRTLDMYMRRRGYVWDSVRQTYIYKMTDHFPDSISNSTTGKVQKIIGLFNMGLEPMEIAKKVGMKDHRTMAGYMKSKGYIWSTEKQNYIFLKGEFYDDDPMPISHFEFNNSPNNYEDTINSIDNKDIAQQSNSDLSYTSIPQLERLENLIPMLEMISRNKDKLTELLSINSSATIPRYVIGGITITKSLCMSHPLAELIKEFSKEKNISQREIFEVAIIEFFKKYGYENEIKALFSS
ncbi:hypothetical protein [Clostridium thailandense]|uniref:hypothetical protein n=1 Tax=Clostridium thailandense TaxID=2794346 RepID=UPI0039892F72